MILIGQLDSPFVRRVAVTMRLMGMSYERRPLSVFADYDVVRDINPLARVPILILDDGEVLVDSTPILDHLDENAGPDRALVPPDGPERRQVLRLVAIALGACEKGAALVYEREKRPPEKVYEPWAARLEGQIESALEALEAVEPAPWLAGARMTQADVTTAVLYDFLRFYHLHLLPAGRYPRLEALAARCAELPAFAEVPVVAA
ncbi:MAG: glutathione S-transferase family protein [Alphaproteobacteria bacterium]